MSLAKNIQFLRKKHNLTQEDLSEFLCVSRQSISKWETGESYPDTEKIIALCDRFDISMDLLVRGDLTSNCLDENSKISENSRNDETSVINVNSETAENIQTENNGSFIDDNIEMNNNIDYNSENINKDPKTERVERMSQAASGIIMIISIAVFITVGLITNIWHPTWISCVCGAFLCAIIGIIFDLKKEKKDYKKIMGSCCGILMCLTSLVYVVMNMFIGKWHPSWIMLVLASLLCAVLGILGDLFDKQSK